nr:MAG TPA: hypothetical protein [Caudoviricetes sp.]
MITVYLVRIAYVRCLKSTIYILNKLRLLKYNLWIRLNCIE